MASWNRAKHSAVTERELAEGSGGVGPSWSRASGDSVATAADAKSAGKARPLGIAKQSATTEHELAESSDEVGPSWSEASGMNNAAARGYRSTRECKPRPAFAAYSGAVLRGPCRG